MKTSSIMVIVALATPSACKGQDPKPAPKPAENLGEAPAPAASADNATPSIAFNKFLTDLMTAKDEDFQARYPAGKAFTTTATIHSPAGCTDNASEPGASCPVQLSDGGKTYKNFDFEIANKPKLANKPAGTTITLDCVPVYEAGSLVFGKSCRVR